MKQVPDWNLLRMLRPSGPVDPASPLGEKAVEAGLITRDRLDECRSEAAARPEVPFRTILEQKGGVSAQALDLLERMIRQTPPSSGFEERYELQEEMGRGGTGVIYRALDRELGRSVAVKFLRTDLRSAPDVIERIRKEGRAVAGLSHPNIPSLHDVGDAGGIPYLVMELVEGRTLADELSRRVLPVREAVELMEKVARTLQYVHGHGIVHRDLKPSNVKIDRNGEPHVLDFGLVHLREGGGELTRTGAMMGTPYYMAPEQVRGEKARIGPQTDVYGSGATLYHALTGSPPFPNEIPAELFSRILYDDPPSCRPLRPEVSRDLDRIVLRCLEKNTSDRYASAGELADDLRRYLDGEPVRAQTSTFASQWWRGVRRRPWRSVALGVAACFLGAIAALLWAQARGADRIRGEKMLALRAGEYTAAYYELGMRTIETMRTLEDVWFEAAGAEDVPALLSEVESAARKAQSQFPQSRLPGAWVALARLYGGGTGGNELEAAVAGSEEDPFPWLLLARGRLAGYAKQARVLEHLVGGGRPEYAFLENEEMRGLLEGAAQALDRALGSPAWREMKKGEEVRIYAEAVRRLSEKNFPEAAARLATLRDDPILKDEASWLLGIALFLSQRYDEASVAFETVARRGWPVALLYAGIGRVHAAWELEAKGSDPMPFLERALEHYRMAIERWPEWATLRFSRAHAYHDLSRRKDTAAGGGIL